MREPEGIATQLPGNVLGRCLVKRPGTPHSQCRGRGFESHHLHQRPRSECQGGIPKITSFVGVTLRDLIGRLNREQGLAAASSASSRPRSGERRGPGDSYEPFSNRCASSRSKSRSIAADASACAVSKPDAWS